MFWTSLVCLGMAGIIAVFVVATDGRYFGKKVSFLIYDRLGPAIFSSSREHERWVDMVNGLQLTGNETVLDVGTATGSFPLYLVSNQDFKGQIWGIDWSPRMIEHAERKLKRIKTENKPNFTVVDVRKGLPFPSSHFDVVFCLGVLETLSRPELILGELRRVLKRNGILVFSCYRGWASLGFSLKYSWYMSHLDCHGLRHLDLVSSKKSHDLVLASVEKVGQGTRVKSHPRSSAEGPRVYQRTSAK